MKYVASTAKRMNTATTYDTHCSMLSLTNRETDAAAERETIHRIPYNKSNTTAPAVTPSERIQIGVSQILMFVIMPAWIGRGEFEQVDKRDGRNYLVIYSHCSLSIRRNILIGKESQLISSSELAGVDGSSGELERSCGIPAYCELLPTRHANSV
jgi:hypothetical protein